VPVPDTLDLEGLRSSGPSPGETLQPEDAPQAAGGAGAGVQAGGGGPAAGAGAGAAGAGAEEPDALVVAALVSMGFSENGSKRAGERAPCLEGLQGARPRCVMFQAWCRAADLSRHAQPGCTSRQRSRPQQRV
jgi:hypothetical protein